MVILSSDVISEAEAIESLKQKPVLEPQEAQEQQQQEQQQSLTLTAEQLQIAINSAVASAIETTTQDLRSQLQALSAENAELKTQKSSLEQVFQVLGQSAPMVNTLGSHRDRPQGLAIDFVQACESAPASVWVDPRSGRSHIQRDMAEAKRLFWTDSQQLRSDMEDYAKQHGFLRGHRLSVDAATLKTDIPSALLDYLSLVMRETHRGRYIYWQFPFYKLELGKGPGDTIQVPRLRWLTEATAVSDRVLTTGTNLSVNRQNIQISAVSIALGERGLGSGSPGTSLPVAIPEFLIAYSLINLEAAVMRVLGHDYESWEDLSIRARYFATTRLVYNDRGAVTTTPGDVGLGDDGTLTEMFLNDLYAYMSGLKIIPLDDGHYVLVVHDKALSQLKNTLAAKNRYLDGRSVEELTALLQPASNREMGKTSGYAGSFCGFHLFSTNAHSMGAVGTEGVQNEVLGVGSTLTRASVAFGQAAVARALGMEAEIRRDSNNDFGRLDSFTWLSHENTADLDVDPAINAEQQLRVIELRTTDVAL